MAWMEKSWDQHGGMENDDLSVFPQCKVECGHRNHQ